MAPQEPYTVIPEWSEKAVRCAVCLRPFPTTAQIDEHSEQECEPTSPCWCEALCWVREGGDCCPADGQDLDVDGLFLALRACQERIAALTAPQERPVCGDSQHRDYGPCETWAPKRPVAGDGRTGVCRRENHDLCYQARWCACSCHNRPPAGDGLDPALTPEQNPPELEDGPGPSITAGLDREAVRRRAYNAVDPNAAGWKRWYAADVPALLGALEAAEAENERHRKANLVRAVTRYAEGHDFDGWVAEQINAENFDPVPWRVAETAIEKAQAAEAEVARLSRVADAVHGKHLRALREAKRLRAYIAALESEVAGSMPLSALVHDEDRAARGPVLRTDGGAS